MGRLPWVVIKLLHGAREGQLDKWRHKTHADKALGNLPLADHGLLLHVDLDRRDVRAAAILTRHLLGRYSDLFVGQVLDDGRMGERRDDRGQGNQGGTTSFGGVASATGGACGLGTTLYAGRGGGFQGAFGGGAATTLLASSSLGGNGAGGGAAVTTGNVGVAGTANTGSGGSGAGSNGTGTFAGGAGGSGDIEVWEYA